MLTRFVQDEVPNLLPFLKHLKVVSLFNGATLVARASLAGNRTASKGDHISVDVKSAYQTARASNFQLSRVEMIPSSSEERP